MGKFFFDEELSRSEMSNMDLTFVSGKGEGTEMSEFVTGSLGKSIVGGHSGDAEELASPDMSTGAVELFSCTGFESEHLEGFFVE